MATHLARWITVTGDWGPIAPLNMNGMFDLPLLPEGGLVGILLHPHARERMIQHRAWINGLNEGEFLALTLTIDHVLLWNFPADRQETIVNETILPLAGEVTQPEEEGAIDFPAGKAGHLITALGGYSPTTSIQVTWMPGEDGQGMIAQIDHTFLGHVPRKNGPLDPGDPLGPQVRSWSSAIPAALLL